MSIDTTVGGAASNSYITLAEANDYVTTRLFNDIWNSSDDPTKTSAILWACRLIDSSFDWNGRATTKTQALAWPRMGMKTLNGYPLASDVLPINLKNAQAEFARQLLADDRSSDKLPEKNDVLNLKAGSVGFQFRNTEGGTTVPMRDADVRRKSADFDYLAKWVPDAARNLLVKTWYKTALVSQPVIFEASGGGRHRHHGR